MDQGVNHKKTYLNRSVVIDFLKPRRCCLCLRSAGRPLHSTAARITNRLSPYCFVRTRGLESNLEFLDRNVRIGNMILQDTVCMMVPSRKAT